MRDNPAISLKKRVAVFVGVNRFSAYEKKYIIDANMGVGIAFATAFIFFELYMLFNNLYIANDPAIVDRVGWNWIIQHRIGYLVQLGSAVLLMVGCLYHAFKRPLAGWQANVLMFQCLSILLVLGTYATYGDILHGNGVYALITQIVAITCIFIIRPIISLPLTFPTLWVSIKFSEACGVLGHGDAVNLYVFFSLIMVSASARYLFAVKAAHSSEELTRDSRTDALTNLGNTRAFKDDMQSYLDRFIVLAAIDVNNFKMYNDRYGHTVGDRTLVLVSQALQRTFGTDARCYRIGGDEFLVASTCLSQEECVARIREAQAVLQSLVQKEGGRFPSEPVTFSSGVSSGTVTRNGDILALKHAADRLMYKDKRSYHAAEKRAAES
jgi:diguanylate cyclase (GGDEF)-like protein